MNDRPTDIDRMTSIIVQYTLFSEHDNNIIVTLLDERGPAWFFSPFQRFI